MNSLNILNLSYGKANTEFTFIIAKHIKDIFPGQTIRIDRNDSSEPIIVIGEICEIGEDDNRIRILIEDTIIYIRTWSEPNRGLIHTLDIADPNSITKLEQIIRQSISTLRHDESN